MPEIGERTVQRNFGGDAKAAPRRQETMYDDAGFYFSMAVLSAVVIFAGFAPSFYLKSVIMAPPPLTALTTTHGVVYTAWVALVVAQASFIAMKKPAPHRLLGIVGAVLFGAIVSLGLSTMITAARLGNAPPGGPAQPAFLALPFIGMAALTGLVVAALVLRRRPDWHKRLMIAALFLMTQPATGRLSFPLGIVDHANSFSFAVMELMLAGAAAYDYRRRKRVHPAYLVAAATYAGLHVAVYWAFGSPAWTAFANALIGA